HSAKPNSSPVVPTIPAPCFNTVKTGNGKTPEPARTPTSAKEVKPKMSHADTTTKAPPPSPATMENGANPAPAMTPTSASIHRDNASIAADSTATPHNKNDAQMDNGKR